MTDRYAVATEYPAQARRVLRSALSEVPNNVLETAELLASELVTNALIHGTSEPVLVLRVGKDRVRVEVRDADATMDLSPRQLDRRANTVAGSPLLKHLRHLGVLSHFVAASRYGSNSICEHRVEVQ